MPIHKLTGLIIEGPDASGKGTLIEHIQKQWPEWLTEDRAADSLTGPRGYLDDYVDQAERSMNHRLIPHLFDRHPLISEPIYGPTIRGCMDSKNPNTRFNDINWLQNRLDFIRDNCLVVFCLPPLENLLNNLETTSPTHMPGVINNATRLYWQYHALAAGWARNSYIYDYTRECSKDIVVDLINLQIGRLKNG